ncbi:EAL domain-containing protein [Marinobacter sp. HL-58]|uniref:EAL domain-containing protein n=1 Tax=Marinobacter sp. HL-58 TaxID=1479237 RepID=UPI000484BB98|nr:EAL domain-containing protein [Marinobacter sp. HL-58]KPQ00031.1 MAG: diguanylate cyclase/phosphodiesterase [Marinobacter sp. HL-58]
MIRARACCCLIVLPVVIAWNTVLADTETVSVDDSSPVAAQFEVWEDPEGKASVEEVTELPDSHWQSVPTGSETFGITSSAYWLRFTVENATGDPLNLLAELAYSQLDDVVFHVFLDGKQVREFRTGDTRPFYPREIDHPSMMLRFGLQPEQVKTIYVRVRTEGSMILPLNIWRESEFFGAASGEQKLHFFYYGSLTVIILINLAVFLTLRERLYLYYALAIAGYLLFFASIKGYSFQLLYPQSPEIHARALLVSMPVLALFSVLFCRALLRIPSHSPKLDIAIRVMIGFEVINFVAALTLSYNAAVMLSAVSALFFFSLLFVAGPVTWAAGVRAGAFFTIAWTPLTIGVLATAGRALGFFPENFMTEHAMQIGSGLEAFILTLALADRLYREREEKIRAQADALREEKARNEAQNRLNEAMTHDPVTGLPNRNRFEWMVNRQLQQDPEGHYMVGVARITRLDEINRTLGLNRSDRLFQGVANQMTELADKLPFLHRVPDSHGRQELVYQLSGDTFGLLVNTSMVNDNFESLNRALKKLTEPVVLDNLAIELHPRFGAASYPEHGDNAAMLIRNAHVGMEITPHGRFETGFYSEKYDIYSESRLTLMSDLREALQAEHTQLYYQPKLCLESGQVIGLEALIRWNHPQRGWILPADFIPLAEETGVITQLTRWAIERGIGDLSGLLDRHPEVTISINISARDLVSGELEGVISSALQRHGVSAQNLTLELTETAAMEDPEQGLAELQRLAGTGLKISIDDFGSGYSSLSYLKQLPATELKLDRSLIDDIMTSEGSRVIVETAVNMAHSLGYHIVAEGVEDDQTARLLGELGCDRIQGFWFCRPLPLRELREWLVQAE